MCLITLLIEDRHHGTDELAEAYVPLKIAGEGLWGGCKGCMCSLAKWAITYQWYVHVYAVASDEIKLTD